MNHWWMKTQLLFIFVLCALNALSAQEPLSRNAALAQLYNQYDTKSETAQWLCTEEQKSDQPHGGWGCSKDDSTVSIDVLLTAQVNENGVKKTYLVASAVPHDGSDKYDCHACTPAIGAAVFAWKEKLWVLESANPAVGFYGGWGDPPSLDLIEVGPARHGLMVSKQDEGQGFAWSEKMLLLPVGKTISQVWAIQDEQDDTGAYDPSDKSATQVLYRSSVKIRFLATEQDGQNPQDYFDIEAISRGTDLEEGTQRLKAENWTEIYRFDGHEYKLLKHTTYREIKAPQKK